MSTTHTHLLRHVGVVFAEVLVLLHLSRTRHKLPHAEGEHVGVGTRMPCGRASQRAAILSANSQADATKMTQALHMQAGDPRRQLDKAGLAIGYCLARPSRVRVPGYGQEGRGAARSHFVALV